MTLPSEIEIPTLSGAIKVRVEGGRSVVFIGANGAGKTRLGVFIDRSLTSKRMEVHRIAAHRSLLLNPGVVPPSYDVARRRLQFGSDTGEYAHKEGHRFQGRPEVGLLNDFDHLLAALYAENNQISVSYRQSQFERVTTDQPPEAKIDKLRRIWQSILPHRELQIEAGNIKTRAPGDTPQEYAASEMSDGERVIFYLLGQTLVAQPNTVLIFDEPELHINKSVLSKLWDEIESSRPDCSFVYITHDVEFASSRHAAEKYAVRSYRRHPNEAWDLEIIPDDIGIPDDVLATIIGSRSPVLFIEGDFGSLDSALYRRVFPQYTVIPVGSCEQVISTVSSFTARKELHRLGCAGLVDADGRSATDIAVLEALGVYCLPVSEVENLLLIPDVFLEIAKALNFRADETEEKLKTLKQVVFSQLNAEMDAVCLRHTKRQIDAKLKKLGLAAKDIASLDAEFKSATASLDVMTIFNSTKSTLSNAIQTQDYNQALLWYDNKGLLAEAARVLGLQKRPFEEFVARTLRSDGGRGLASTLSNALPKVKTRP